MADRFWQSLDQLKAGRRTIPTAPTRLDAKLVSRQQFLKLMSASLALAGLTACARPTQTIVPYVRRPEEVVPGKPLYYATATTLGGYASGVLVKSVTGRPIKVEGNPDHPASLGATDIFSQAAVLTLYDPERSQTLLRRGEIRSWEEFLGELLSLVEAQRASRGAGLRLLTETITSPSFADQIRTLHRQLPAATWHQYDPVGQDNTRAGTRLAFGEDVATRYRVDRAAVILSLDADLLGALPGHLRYAHDFADIRRVADGPPGSATASRLYVVESAPTITGAVADHRWPVRPSEVGAVARALAARLGLPGVTAPSPLPLPEAALEALARDLRTHLGAGLIVVGERQPPEVHLLGHELNGALGNLGTTVEHTAPVEVEPIDQTASLRDLVRAMAAGQVDLLLILGANPVYTAPVDLAFGDALARVGTSIHLGLYHDETAARCTWHVPQAHELETWADARAFDGTVTILQPLIAPLYDGKSPLEILGIVNGLGEPTSHAIVRGYWERQQRGDFEQFWRSALHAGTVPGTTLPPKRVTFAAPGAIAPSPRPAGGGTAEGESGRATTLDIVFQSDPTIYDGRFANNGWLQELPKPLTRLTWDNVVLLSPATAERLGVANEDVVELRYRGRSVRAPVWVMPGQPNDTAVVQLGYGRTRAGTVGTGVGYNAYLLRTSDAPWFGSGLELRPTGERYPLASTQGHQTMEGRPVILTGTLEQLRRNPRFVQEEATKGDGSLYPGFSYDGYAWGMAIDLSACIGCGACVIACQAENNIPVVGKDQVRRERELHWLRVDRYYRGDPANPESFAQPVPCMHCETAPCELVCPVGATVHSAEGLNDMVYNRCVGTRYCSNNCPYKVRRFNFYQYADWTTPSLKLLRNPSVSVRERGVMEKCTYCVQRISAARIQAEEEGRPIRDGDVLTACQAACPTRAIVFGNQNDPTSQVARLKAGPLTYQLLGELNTRPRTTYLAAIRNPNPALVASLGTREPTPETRSPGADAEGQA